MACLDWPDIDDCLGIEVVVVVAVADLFVNIVVDVLVLVWVLVLFIIGRILVVII